MLGKLTKNSFKANFQSVSNVYFAMGIMAVVMLFMYLFDWSKTGEQSIGVVYIVKILIDSALCLTAAIGTIVTLVKVVSEYNRNMFGAEGHLTMSLPVRSSTLLLSKWISGSFWIMMSYIILCVCVIASVIDLGRYSLGVMQGNEQYTSAYNVVSDAVRLILEEAGVGMPPISVLLSLITLYACGYGVRIIVFVLLLYFAVTLSHCRPFHKLGKFGKIIYFLGITFIVSTFAKMITSLVKVYLLISDTAYSFTLLESDVEAAWQMGFAAIPLTNIYCTAIASVFIFLITTVLIDRHVNIS